MNTYRTLSNSRMDQVQTPVIPLVADLIQQNPGTISMGQGVVYYPPPPGAFKKLSQLEAGTGIHQYCETGGIPELRNLLVDKLSSENAIDMDSGRRITVTAGSNMAFLNTLFAITYPGDEIILIVPFYFNHEMAIRMLSCQPVLVNTNKDYLPDITVLQNAITDRTRAIVTISPNNPGGVVYSPDLLAGINHLCKENNIYHISDEAYEYFTYDGISHFSPGSLPDSAAHTISLYSMSKSYGFASWRIGYMVYPEHLAGAVYKAQDTNLICPAIASQYAAIGALEEGRRYCMQKLDSIGEVRKILLSRLAGIESFCSVSNSNGAFYILLKLHTDMVDMQVTEQLVRNYRIAVLPGSTFGLSDGCYLRVAYGALDKINAEEGITRLMNGLTDIIQ